MDVLGVDHQLVIEWFWSLAGAEEAIGAILPTHILHLINFHSKPSSLLLRPPLIDETLSLDLLRVDMLEGVLLDYLPRALALDDLLAALLRKRCPLQSILESRNRLVAHANNYLLS